MTKTTEHPKECAELVERELKPVTDLVAQDPKCLEDPALSQYADQLVVAACRGDLAKAVHLLTKWGLLTCERCRQLVATLKALKEQSPTLAWLLQPPFAIKDNGAVRKFAIAATGSRGSVPGLYLVPDVDDDAEAARTTERNAGLPSRCLVHPATQLYLGPATEVPVPPFPAEFFDVVAARVRSDFNDLGELEVSDAMEKTISVYAGKDLVHEVETKMDDGQTVKVRVENGLVATAIHETKDTLHADWLEFPPSDGPSIAEMIFPRWLAREWERDTRYLVEGRPLKVLLIGPTGTGKSDAVVRAGRDAAKRTGKKFALIRISPSTVGSSYIHATPRKMRAAMKQAESLWRRGFLTLVVWDEGDSLLGEMDGGEHTHNRSERLAAQELLSAEVPFGVYLTMNPRRNSWLPAPITRRFRKRVYPRPFRSQMAAVAACYVSIGALKVLRVSREEFGGVLADVLYSDDRVVAVAHCHSGHRIPVRVRDLQCASPGKVRDLLTVFCQELEDGEAQSLEYLWAMLEQEFSGADLNVRNLFDLTFLTPPENDTIRSVEIAK